MWTLEVSGQPFETVQAAKRIRAQSYGIIGKTVKESRASLEWSRYSAPLPCTVPGRGQPSSLANPTLKIRESNQGDDEDSAFLNDHAHVSFINFVDNLTELLSGLGNGDRLRHDVVLPLATLPGGVCSKYEHPCQKSMRTRTAAPGNVKWCGQREGEHGSVATLDLGEMPLLCRPNNTAHHGQFVRSPRSKSFQREWRRNRA